MMGTDPDSPLNPSCSPWLCLSTETQTQIGDEDVDLRPINLCNIQTQTIPWNEVADDDSTELAHSETQTLLSSFLLDQLSDCDSARRILAKQNSTSEDASTDPMEIFH